MRLFDKILAVNQSVEVTWKGAKRRFRSRIEIVGKRTVTIAAPLEQGIPVYAEPGTPVNIDIFYEGKRYGFVAPLQRSIPGQIPFWELEKPKELKVINLREFFRLDVSLPAKIAEQEEAEPVDSWLECTVINLSGNGLLAAVDADQWNNAKEVRVAVSLPGAQMLRLSGEVVRKELVETSASRVVRLAIHFGDVNTYAQNAIMKFLFAEQRKRRARGLL